MLWSSALVGLSILVLGILSILTVSRLESTDLSRWDRPRSRLYLGVPWGSITVILLVVSVYLFVQDGVTSIRDPVVIPYRAWSYQYPLGMVTAPFSHASLGHLLGNLTGALVLAPIAEYAWGHYPPASHSRSESVWRDPRVRAFVVFPAIVSVVALATSFFAVGPVIGFSGVIFAFAGFAIVFYPIATIVASLGLHGAVLTVIRAILSPVSVATVEPGPPMPPSWASIAIQAHALGFLIGVLLAIAVARDSDSRPDPRRLWIALVLFGSAKSLWAIYWYGAEGTYVLFRGPGVLVVLALSVLVTVAVTATDRPLVAPARERDRSPDRAPSGLQARVGVVVTRLGRAVRTTVSSGRARALGRLPRQQTAVTLVILVVAVLSGPALALNAVAVDPASSDPAFTVGEYAVAYEESVENRLVSVVPVDAYGPNETVTASGVIVWSRDRSLWTAAVSADRLAYSGTASIELGGPGWRETVTVERTGWNVVGNGSSYQVWIDSPSNDRTLAYESGPHRSSVVIDGAKIAFTSVDGEFVLRVGDGTATPVTRKVPAAGESVTIDGIRIVRDEGRIVVEHDGTRAVIASRETYN